MEEQQRTTLTTGMRSRRYILIPVILFCGLDVISNFPDSTVSLIILVISIVLYYLINNSRWMSFDDNNLYIINGKREKTIHFTDIVSIKKSAAKINGSRFWKIRYKEGDGTEKTRRYYPPFLGSEQKQFYTAVQKVNSKVVVWTHPHFNH